MTGNLKRILPRGHHSRVFQILTRALVFRLICTLIRTKTDIGVVVKNSSIVLGLIPEIEASLMRTTSMMLGDKRAIFPRPRRY